MEVQSTLQSAWWSTTVELVKYRVSPQILPINMPWLCYLHCLHEAGGYIYAHTCVPHTHTRTHKHHHHHITHITITISHTHPLTSQPSLKHITHSISPRSPARSWWKAQPLKSSSYITLCKLATSLLYWQAAGTITTTGNTYDNTIGYSLDVKGFLY